MLFMAQSRPAALEHCQTLWLESRAGRTHLGLLQAVAGLGKSHFLQEFAAKLPSGLALTVRGSSLLTGLLRSAHGLLHNEADPALLETARRYAPELAWRIVAGLKPLEPEQTWLCVALALEKAAVRLGGLCILIEDIHDYSSDDLTILRFLYRQWLHGRAPILLLLSARPHLDESVWQGLETDALFAKGAAPARLELSALDAAGVAKLAQQVLIGAEIPPELGAWLLARSEGHPLFALELLRFLQHGGMLQNLGATWQLHFPPNTVLPSGLEALLLARLESVRFEPDVWLALTHLAVLGHPTTPTEWQVLTGLKTEVMQRVQRRLLTLGLVRSNLQNGQTIFSGAHLLYADLVLSLLTDTEAQIAYTRAFEVTNNLSRKAVLARACNHPQAQIISLEAWQHSLENFAWADVLLHGQALLEMEVGAAQPSHIKASLADGLMVQGKFIQALEIYQQLETSDSVDGVSYCLARLVRDREGFEFTDLQIERFGWAVRYYWTCFAMRLGMRQTAEQRLELAFSLSTINTPERVYALYCEHWFIKIFTPHRLARQLEIFEAVESNTGRVPDYNVFAWKANVYTALGELESAKTTMELVLAQHRQRPYDATEANNLVALGKIAFAESHYLAARQHYLAALRVATASLDPIHQSYAHFGLYCTDYALGLECKEHLERYYATNASMEFSLYDAPNDLEIAWREISLGRQLADRQALVARVETCLGSDCLAAARLLLLEGDQGGALLALQRWQAETWLEAGIPKTQAEPAEYGLLLAMAQRNLGKKSVCMRAFERALTCAKNPVQQAEIRLASSLVANAPSSEALEQLRLHGAGGLAVWLRRLFAGAIESLEYSAPESPNSSHFIRTFSTFGLEQNGKLKPWKAQKARDLLALLICASLQEQAYVSREEILDTVWSDNDPATADGAFRVTVSRLRDALGQTARIERDQQGRYGLVGANLDVTQFLTSLSSRDLERAATWYTGDFLSGIEFEKAANLRETLRQQWRTALLQLAFESSDTRATTHFETLLESDPLDLEALQGLAKSWAAMGANLRLKRILEKSRSTFLAQVGELPHELSELLRQMNSSQGLAKHIS